MAQQPKRAPRPGRTLAVLAVVIAAMYAVMFLTDNTVPRLGLDLQGGTSVILQPRLAEGEGDVPQSSLTEAVDIIRQRVNGLGVTEADVQTQGPNIVVSVPGATSREAVELVASTAELTFRPVLQVAAGAPVPIPTASPEATPDPAATPSSTAATPAPGETPAATPSTATSGRAVPPALLAQPTTPAADPTATAEPTAPATSGPTAPPSATVTPEIQAQFDALDCTRPENRQGGGVQDPEVILVTCDQEGTAKYLLAPVAVEGSSISDADSGVRQGTTTWVVTLQFDSEGTQQFTEVTTELAAQQPPLNQFAIVLDGIVVSAPAVSNPIPGGSAEITGDFTQQEASDLANVLRYGALPLTFDQGEVNTISPSVGRDQLEKGLLAGLIGLGLVVIYAFLFYRALGLVSVLSLAVAGLITYASVVLLGAAIGFTLILAGVIGVIVSIGITADSFIVYFERLRDEIREGRSIRAAVERAWPRARRTILVADLVTFFGGVILYFVAIGRVQNFAFTLALTTVIDVIVVFFFTKPLVSLLVRTEFFGQGHPLSGLNPRHIGAESAAPRWRSSGPGRVPVGTATRGES
ncbi:MAG TPA: protein translocase subunit SecD [Actinomycetes bacterium]|nr:protein translocase subunit SecD [Actinomycetes bacterium]